jgi:ATPase subunit of ABC transporter with duplicated ATPase domains
MLQIKNLTVIHKKDLKVLLDDFSFSLNPGNKAVIIGEEGNGKSTLLKLIYDEKLVEDYVEYKGEIIKGTGRIGYVAQELAEEQRSQTVFQYFSESPYFFDLNPKELSEIAVKLGLPHDIYYSQQLVGTLSGGEKVKVQFAKMLMGRPDVLLLDEPTNDIDIDTLEWLEEYINICGLPLIFVSHDETLIEKTANVIIHIEQVRRKTLSRHTIAKMPYTQYLQEREAKLSHQEQIAKKEQSEFEARMEKYRKIYRQVEHEQRTISRGDPSGGRLLKKKMKSVKAMGKRFEKEKESMTQAPDTEEAIMIKFDENITVPKGKTVIDFESDLLCIGERVLSRNIKLMVTGGQKICIIGKNGIGKSTLLKKITEQILDREDIKVGYMPQDYEEMLDLTLTPVEFLSKTGRKEEVTRIRTYLGSMKYTTDEMEHTVSELSRGQKAKLLFIKMILEGCNVLVLDEPTRNFSPLSNPVIRDVLKSYNGVILSVSHDRKYIKEVCDQIYELTEAGLVYMEKPSF